MRSSATECACMASGQGRSDGGYMGIYIPPKSVQVNFLWGKMTSERVLNSFIHPKNLYPQKQNSGWLYAPASGSFTALPLVLKPSMPTLYLHTLATLLHSCRSYRDLSIRTLVSDTHYPTRCGVFTCM